MLLASKLEFLLAHGQWLMTWPCSQVRMQYKIGLLKEWPHIVLRKSLWEFEGYIKVRFVDAHKKKKKNTISGLKRDLNQKIEILISKVYEKSALWEARAMQRWDESKHTTLESCLFTVSWYSQMGAHFMIWFLITTCVLFDFAFVCFSVVVSFWIEWMLPEKVFHLHF